MTIRHSDSAAEGFDLVRSGVTYRLADRTGMAATSSPRRLLKVLLLLFVTWVPLLLLSLLSGHFSGSAVQVPFLHDPEVHARFLVVLPLLELADVIVALSLA